MQTTITSSNYDLPQASTLEAKGPGYKCCLLQVRRSTTAACGHVGLSPAFSVARTLHCPDWL